MKQTKFLFAAFFACLINSPLISNDIYESIKILPFDPFGTFATESSLDKIFLERDIKTVVELGCWTGASTRFFGYRVGEGGKVYAVDHWQGTQNHRPEMTDTRLSYIYHLFLSNIRHAELTDRIVPVRMTTDEAAKALDVKADLIYIDASRNGEQVFKDIMNWYPHLNEEGVMCGAEWREPGISKGVRRAAEKLGKDVEVDRKGLFWLFK